MSSLTTPSHLIIDKGPQAGRQIEVPIAGGRIGRSPENDIILNDDSLSRFHCRVFFKDEVLTVADLASTNETLVNGQAITEAVLSVGDQIEIGETILRVTSNRLDGKGGSGKSPVDLGFKPVPEHGTRPSRRALPIVIAVAVILVTAAIFLRSSQSTSTSGPQTPRAADLSIRYEKVDADRNNIFRYSLTLEKGLLSARVDDLANHRHISREGELDERLLNSLAASLEKSSFFQLQKEYSGLSGDSWTLLDLEIGLTSQIHRSKVSNRLEPADFQSVREFIEEFAQNELGLAALAMPPEKLLELSVQAVQLGQKLFDQRAIANGNLYKALQSFREAAWYLETIDPKPDHYALAVSGEEESLRMLNEWVSDYEFKAERAIKLTNWADAAQELKSIIEQLPDQADDRYKKARRKLLDVERRMNR